MSSLIEQRSEEVRRLSYPGTPPRRRASEFDFGLICLALLGALGLFICLAFPGPDWGAAEFLLGP
ncbi:MAG TPA: hypothetical protein VGP86_05065 [Xanthobacteraceae bacterium]|jgi:hypothetical protein|nr:hypothetical protein [Xanthobacteraceae bacterium]